MTVPSFQGWESVGFEGLDGAVWLRTSFILPTNMVGKNLILDLNRIRNYDITYINGNLVGTIDSDEPRKYTIPKEMLHPGKNTIAIQVINYNDKGGLSGYKDTTKQIGIFPEDAKEGDTSAFISLKGQWKCWIQNDAPPALGDYQASYQPFGDLFLHFNHKNSSHYKRELDIRNAIATTSYSDNGVEYKRSYIASQPNQCVVVRLTANKMGSISFYADLNSQHKNASVKRIDAQTIALSVQVRFGALRGESFVKVVTKGGKVKVENGKIFVENANEAMVFLTAGTNYKNYHDVSKDAVQPCIDALQTVKDKAYEQIEAAHIKEYQQYFNTYSINLGTSANALLPTDQRIEQFATSNDPSFVALYQQYGRYLLISSSRPGTRPANLQGIWNDQINPPWGSKYTVNINTEMNYWPAELLNLSPLHQPLFDMIEDLSVTGQQTAKAYYNAPGWVLHHNTDLWRGTAAINAANHGIWVTGGAWLCHHLWEHYQFTQDKVFLKEKAYPIMKAAAQFFNHYLVKDPKTGWLISAPSNSPEQGGLVAGPTMDHQIIRDLFKNVIAASELLQLDAPLRKALQEQYTQIAPNLIGRYGQLQEWMQDKDDSSNKHRHVSHLWAVYPGNEINWDETPELTKAARQSLIFRGDAATGWSLGWKINFWSRFKDGDHTFKMIQMLMSPAISGAGSYPNLFDAHPPFQIDGNFGGAAGIGELMVQSHTQYIDILPALPAALPNGEVKGICARGGFVLDMQWKDGKLVKLIVHSKTGNPLKIRYNGAVVTMKTFANGIYQFNNALKRS
jgi:alpha-L-fucosidase 2